MSNKRLNDAKSALLVIERNQRKLTSLKSTYATKVKEQKVAFETLEKENKDVEKITGISLDSFIATLFNNRDEKIDKEEMEAIAAKKKYDAIAYEVESLLSEIETIKSSLLYADNVRREYELAFEEHRAHLLTTSPEAIEYVNEISNKQTLLERELKEIQEALAAATLVEASINLAKKELKAAKDFGVWDMLGGGMLVTMAKRSHMSSAQSAINRMNHDLKQFSKELADVNMYTSMSIDIADYMTFADYFFDGLLFDMMVQSKINKASDQIAAVNREVSKVKRNLTVLKKERVEEIQGLTKVLDNYIINQ